MTQKRYRKVVGGAVVLDINGRSDFEVGGVSYPANWIAHATLADLVAVGLEPYDAPDDGPMPVLSDRQFFQGLAEQDIIPWEQAFAAVKTGDIPVELQGYIDQIPDPLARTRAAFKVSGAVEFRFDDPLVPLIAAQKGWDTPTLHAFWTFCATL